MSRAARWSMLAGLLVIVSMTSGWADEGRIALFRREVATYPMADASSITRAATRFKEIFRPASLEQRDRGFLAFVGFFRQVEEGVGRHLEGREISRETRLQLRAHGLVVLSSEGMSYVAEDADYMRVTFGSFLSPAYARFLAIRQGEMREGFTEDAGLRITFRRLGERVVTWEGFLRQHPRCVAREQAAYFQGLYLATFLTGLDNSRVFGVDGKVEPEVRRAWQHVVKTWPGTTTARLVAEYSRVLGRSGFRESRQSQAFLKGHGIHSMLGVQPPTR